jgi:1-acyl-sn-glycerol-3-phosphate acyltransferase
MIRNRYTIPIGKRLFRWFFRPIFRLIFHLLSPITITGKQNIPHTGAYLVAFNHVSLYDAPFILAFWPRPLEILGAQEIWSRPGQNLLARLYGAIPVLRGEVDRDSVAAILGALRSGHPLLMAPEGGRSHGQGMKLGKPGVVHFVEATGVKVLPVGIIGTTDDYFHKASKGLRPPVVMHIGEAFRIPDDLGEQADSPREMRQEKVDYIMRHIAELLPIAYRGVYNHPA